MDALSTASDLLADRPVLRAGLAALAALALVVTPFQAMNAGDLPTARHVDGYDDPCTEGCDTSNEICCNEPIP